MFLRFISNDGCVDLINADNIRNVMSDSHANEWADGYDSGVVIECIDGTQIDIDVGNYEDSKLIDKLSHALTSHRGIFSFKIDKLSYRRKVPSEV